MFHLEGHPDAVTCLAYSPGGKVLASGDAGGGFNLWGLKQRRVLRSFYQLGAHKGRFAERMSSIAWSADGKHLVTTTGTIPPFVRVWRWKGSALDMVHEWEATWSTNAAVFHPDGRTVVSAGGTGTGERLSHDAYPILRWDLETGEHTEPMYGHDRDVFALACSPDGRLIASGSADRTARLWDAGTGAEVAVRRFGGYVQAVAFSPSGSHLAVAAGRTAYLWQVEGPRKTARPMKGHTATVLSVAFHPARRVLASAGLDGTVRLWDVASGAVRGAFDWAGGEIGAVAFAPDGLTAAAGVGARVLIWDVDEV